MKKSLVILITFTVCTFILRLPTLFEPHWYFDEGIYATVGSWWLRGASLYKEVWDHKPPGIFIIYGIAFILESLTKIDILFWVKLAATLSVIFTEFVLYKTTSLILSSSSLFVKRQYLYFLPPGLYLLLTSLPFYEGYMANTEIFLSFFTTLGVFLLLQNNYNVYHNVKKCIILGSAGISFSLAVLLKQAAISDFLFAFLFSSLTFSFFSVLLFLSGAFFTLLITSIYFFLCGSFPEFLHANMFYNLSYVSSPLSNSNYRLLIHGVQFLVVLLSLCLLIKTGKIFKQKKISNSLSEYNLFFLSWFLISSVVISLPWRPYLHYLIQVCPIFCLLVGTQIASLRIYLRKGIRLGAIFLSFLTSFIYLLLLLFIPLNEKYKFSSLIPYQFNSFVYEQNFWNWILKRKTHQDYLDFFGHNLSLNEKIINLLQGLPLKMSDREIFIWGGGEAPWLYYDSNLKPATRYTNFFHLEAQPNEIEETWKNLQQKPPLVIITFNNALYFPQLEKLLKRNYQKWKDLSEAVIYLRIPDSPQLSRTCLYL